MKKHLPLIITLGLFAALILCSAQAAQGAREGLAVCARTLAPSLLPFFVLSGLMSALGLPDLLTGKLSSAAASLFRVSPAGAQAFLLGITGGYPLGASAVADLRRQGLVSREEGQRLAAFCNNSGPAFILGAAGGVFHSPAAGALLYVSHVLAALTVGVLFRGRAEGGGPAGNVRAPEPLPFGKALTAAMTRAVSSTMTVCGYVVLFSALLAVLGAKEHLAGLPLALFTGFFELGGGIAALAGTPPEPTTLAAAALILGWGGLSVHCQTMGVLADTDISCARHLAGRALCGAIAAVFTYLGALVLF